MEFMYTLMGKSVTSLRVNTGFKNYISTQSKNPVFFFQAYNCLGLGYLWGYWGPYCARQWIPLRGAEQFKLLLTSVGVESPSGGSENLAGLGSNCVLCFCLRQ